AVRMLRPAQSVKLSRRKVVYSILLSGLIVVVSKGPSDILHVRPDLLTRLRYLERAVSPVVSVLGLRGMTQGNVQSSKRRPSAVSKPIPEAKFSASWALVVAVCASAATC